MNILRQFRALWALFRNGYLRNCGWFDSFVRHQAIDKQGRPIPWLNYSFMEFFTGRLKPEFNFFEFGCGNSTIFWSNYVQVDAVEHNKTWFEYIQNKLPITATIKCVPDGEEYEQEILHRNKFFDIVLVDGIRRMECVKCALQTLSESGVIVLDDSFREEYQMIFELLQNSGFKVIEFAGLAPIYNNYARTAIFYRPGNCLEI